MSSAYLNLLNSTIYVSILNETWMEDHSKLYDPGQQLSSGRSGRLAPRAARGKLLTQSIRMRKWHLVVIILLFYLSNRWRSSSGSFQLYVCFVCQTCLFHFTVTMWRSSSASFQICLFCLSNTSVSFWLCVFCLWNTSVSLKLCLVYFNYVCFICIWCL